MEETKKQPFCDNAACRLHAVMVNEACESIEGGGIKVSRHFFSPKGEFDTVRLCDTCSGVVPFFVRIEKQDVTAKEVIPLWKPSEKQIILQ